MRKDIRSKCCIIHSCFVDWMYFQFGWTYATLILCRPGLHWCCVVLFWIWTCHEWVCITTCVATYAWQTLWPSGLRRNVKAVVFIGVGSNPIGVMFFTPPSWTNQSNSFCDASCEVASGALETQLPYYTERVLYLLHHQGTP